MEHPRTLNPTLVGSHLTLRPVKEGDEAEFAKAAMDLSTFRFFVTEVPPTLTPEGFRPYVDRLLTDSFIFGFAVILNETQEIIGSSSYLDIRPRDRHVEIGMTWYSPKYRGTVVNPECKLLMLDYAFQELRALKVTLKCDARNVHSAGAIQKLGAVPEGVFRKHRLNEFGEFRDTAYFAIFEDDYPTIREKLLQRVASYRDSRGD
jgi:N-acetyltransferase